jgi:hypothetical protein
MIFSENRYPLFGIMLYTVAGATPARTVSCSRAASLNG